MKNTELAVQDKTIELKVVTPVLDVLNRILMREFKLNLNEVVDETNRAIELGVETDQNAADAEATFQQTRGTVKLGNEIRLFYTRPIDAGKKKLMSEVEDMLKPAVDSRDKLDGMLIERKRKITEAKEKAQHEAEEKQRIANEEAAKREETNRNISIGMGGDGNVKPVIAETIQTPISTVGMRNTTRTRSIPDLEKIQSAVDEGIREIAGVKIYCVWQSEVTDSKKVPKEYRRMCRG